MRRAVKGNSSTGQRHLDYRYISVPLHFLTVLLGAGVLIGWAVDVPALLSFSARRVLMKPFSAFFFVLAGMVGICQTLWPEKRRTIRFILSTLMFLLSALFMFQNVSGLHTGVEQWLFGARVSEADPDNGPLIALGTALAFMFIAGSFLAQLTGRYEAAAWLLVMPLSIGALALLGYGYGVRELYALGSMNALALHTALGLCMVTAATWCSIHQNRMLALITSNTPHARALRRIGPPLILVPFLLGIVEAHLIKDGNFRPAMASAAVTMVQIIILGALLAWHLISVYREQELRAAAEHDREMFMNRLAEHEERLRLAFAGGSLGWWEFDPKSRQTRIAPETAVLFGLPRDETRSSIERLRGCVHPDDRAQWEQTFERARPGTGPYADEYRVVWRDGSVHWLASRGRIIRDERGEAERVVGIIADITERKRAEDAVSASEQKFRRIFEAANDGIWVLDHDARIQMVNPRMAEMLGYSDAEMLGKRKFDFVAPEEVPLAQLQFERRRQNISEEFELRLRHRDGREVWTLFAARAVFEEGKFQGVLDLITDITQRKHAELQLARAQEELKQHAHTLEERVAERTAALQETILQLEAFSYSITHDMRGPLRAISGFAGILEQDYGPRLDDTARAYLRRMTSATQRLDSLIQDVLDFSRLSKGEMTLESIEISELIHDIVHQYPDLSARRSHIHIGCVDFRVRANLAALTQALSNLIGNALKFVPDGREPKVDVRCEVIEGFVRIWVVDNGIGIEADYHEKIWGAFSRLHQTDEYPGTGIGLAIVKKAADRMNGRVGLESQPGHGSRFWLDLPRA